MIEFEDIVSIPRYVKIQQKCNSFIQELKCSWLRVNHKNAKDAFNETNPPGHQTNSVELTKSNATNKPV